MYLEISRWYTNYNINFFLYLYIFVFIDHYLILYKQMKEKKRKEIIDFYNIFIKNVVRNIFKATLEKQPRFFYLKKKNQIL